MAIRIVRVGELYDAEVSPPNADAWHATTPLTPTEVLAELSARGCHSTDITDALDEADAASAHRQPSWRSQHNAAVLRRRGDTP